MDLPYQIPMASFSHTKGRHNSYIFRKAKFLNELFGIFRKKQYICIKIEQKQGFLMMNTAVNTPLYLEVKLGDNAVIADIKKALKMIKGVASVRVAHTSHRGEISPALARRISEARKQYIKGETVSCSTPEEMQRYFDSL